LQENQKEGKKYLNATNQKNYFLIVIIVFL